MTLWGSRYFYSSRKIMGTRKIATGTLLLFVFTISGACRSHAQRYLCSDGFGSFSSEFSTGITVTVGPAKNDGFATHSCGASLRWGKHVVPVVTGAYRVDIDVMGADLGLGVPVVAFQIKRTDVDHLMMYQIYSLNKPPRLLQTITGASSYDTRDRNLEGRTEIWTDDAGAVDGFEHLPLYDFDFLPTVALRFEKRQLTDVSSEFQPYFDRQIAQIKAHLDAHALSEFKNTDGSLSSIPPNSLGDLHTLMRTKIAILEIVWSYLYSGREQEAWNALAGMWPPADLNRIRSAIESARAHGILLQVQESPTQAGEKPWKHHATIFNMVTEHQVILQNSALSAAEDMGLTQGADSGGKTPSTVDTGPKAIFLGISHKGSEQPTLEWSQVYLKMIVDSAGKVHSAEPANKADRTPGVDTDIRASAEWNFIPAFRSGRPVACRIQMNVSLQQ